MSTKAKKATKTAKQANNEAAVTQAPTTKVAPPEGFKAKRAVTLPAIVLKEGITRCLKLTEPMHMSAAKVEAKNKEGKEMDPATVCAAVDVVSGEMGNFVVPAVVKGNLEEKYPDQSYVGCVFQITHMGKRPGKRYADFTVIELEAE